MADKVYVLFSDTDAERSYVGCYPSAQHVAAVIATAERRDDRAWVMVAGIARTADVTSKLTFGTTPRKARTAKAKRAPTATATDASAPYGRRKDGTAKGKPGRKVAANGGAEATAGA